MKGGRRSRTITKPWNMPIAIPMASVTAIAAQIGQPPTISIATTVLARPTTAPTDRSMPAVMITKVWPIAMIVHSDAWRSRLVKLL